MPSKSYKPKPDSRKRPSNPLASKATLRDMFAAAALQALVTTSRDPRVAADLLSTNDVESDRDSFMSVARRPAGATRQTCTTATTVLSHWPAYWQATPTNWPTPCLRTRERAISNHRYHLWPQGGSGQPTAAKRR